MKTYNICASVLFRTSTPDKNKTLANLETLMNSSNAATKSPFLDLKNSQFSCVKRLAANRKYEP